jgi:uncharacterized protein (DUF302 family)
MTRSIKRYSALLIGLVLIGYGAYLMAPRAMIAERASPYGFDQTIETIVGNARDAGWVVSKIYDFQKALMERGQADVGRVKVIELCHPGHASHILGGDAGKRVAPMMPCAVGVYEKSDGRTYVATMNLSFFSRLFPAPIGDTLGLVAAEDARMMAFLE